MLHRYEDVILPSIDTDFEIGIGKITLMTTYGITTQELLKDAVNIFFNYPNAIVIPTNGVTLAEFIKCVDMVAVSGISVRWQEMYDKVWNKIPLVNFLITYYEILATIINKYCLCLMQYYNQTQHIVLCEGLPNINLQVIDVTTNPGADPILNSNYVILRVGIFRNEQ